MPLSIGNGLITREIKNKEINKILNNKNEINNNALWNKIKDIFCSTKKSEALRCIHKLCHPSVGTSVNDVKNTFNQLKELASPGWRDNLLHGGAANRNCFDSNDYYSIIDVDGNEIISIDISYDYKVTNGKSCFFFTDGKSYSYPLHPLNKSVSSENRKEILF